MSCSGASTPPTCGRRTSTASGTPPPRPDALRTWRTCPTWGDRALGVGAAEEDFVLLRAQRAAAPLSGRDRLRDEGRPRRSTRSSAAASRPTCGSSASTSTPPRSATGTSSSRSTRRRRGSASRSAPTPARPRTSSAAGIGCRAHREGRATAAGPDHHPRHRADEGRVMAIKVPDLGHILDHTVDGPPELVTAAGDSTDSAGALPGAARDAVLRQRADGSGSIPTRCTSTRTTRR